MRGKSVSEIIEITEDVNRSGLKDGGLPPSIELGHQITLFVFVPPNSNILKFKYFSDLKSEKILKSQIDFHDDTVKTLQQKDQLQLPL